MHCSTKRKAPVRVPCVLLTCRVLSGSKLECFLVTISKSNIVIKVRPVSNAKIIQQLSSLNHLNQPNKRCGTEFIDISLLCFVTGLLTALINDTQLRLAYSSVKKSLGTKYSSDKVVWAGKTFVFRLMINERMR